MKDALPADPDLAPDLEWLLTNAQADDALLCQSLAHEFGPFLVKLWQVWLGGQAAAWDAAADTLAGAVLRSNHWRPGGSLRAWLVKTALRLPVWSKRIVFTAIGPRWAGRRGFLRFTVNLLSNRFGFSAQESAQATGMPLAAVERWLVEENSSAPPAGETASLPADDAQEFDALGRSSLQRLGEMRRRQRRWLLGAELLLGGCVLLLAGLLGRFAAAAPQAPIHPSLPAPFTPGQRFWMDRRTPGPPQITPTLVTPQLLPAAADRWSELDERMQHSDENWATLWAQALVVEYGPVGYVGPPKLFRNELWAVRGGNRLAVFGTLTEPDYLLLCLNDQAFEMIGSQWAYHWIGCLSFHGYTSPLAQLDTAQRVTPPGDWLAQMLLSPSALIGGAEPVVHGEEIWQGRRALVLETVQGNWLWVDARSGMALAWRQVHPNDRSVVVRDVVITGLTTDANFPVLFFDHAYHPGMRWAEYWRPQAGSAAGVSQRFIRTAWGRERRLKLPGLPLPDLATARLVFQQQYSVGQPGRPLSYAGFDLFADGVYLGQAVLGDPWTLACKRSPDGEWLAVEEVGPNAAESGARILSLRQPAQELDLFLARISLENLAFSPDGSQLIYSDRLSRPSRGGVYLYDLQQGTKRRLLDLDWAAGFVWRPDGERVVFVGRFTPDRTYFLVIDAASGEIVEFGDLLADGSIPSSAFFLNWGAPYELPLAVGGLEDCALRPDSQ